MSQHSPQRVTRRTVLKGVGTAAAIGLGATAPAAAQSSGGADLSGWFSNTSNFDGVVDETGSGEVTVTVGSEANGGKFGFGPAAVRVDPGTTVTWKWSGGGGSHNVVAEDGSFESELVSEKGHTFSQTFESEGVYEYACTPHKAVGMKGAIVVGDVSVSSSSSSSSSGSTATPDQTESSSTETASEPSVDFGDWFSNTSNFDAVVDETGSSEVTVTVGSEANGGKFGFGPAAVRVDPGTTIKWKWSGGGGSHNVVAEDGSFESELVAEKGHTFSKTFESEGVYEYACTPHKAMGMKGAIVVSGGGGSGGESGGASDDMGTTDLLTLASGVGLVGALLGGFGLATRSMGDE